MVRRDKLLKRQNCWKLARHLYQSAQLAEKIADSEERDRLATQRRNLAENLRLAAGTQMADPIEELESMEDSKADIDEQVRKLKNLRELADQRNGTGND